MRNFLLIKYRKLNQIDALWWIALAAFFVFFGRAWQHLIWDSPLRTVFWDESLMSRFFGPVFQMTWNEYVTSGDSDFWIQFAIRAAGAFFVLCTGTVLYLGLRSIKTNTQDTSGTSSSHFISKSALFIGGALLVGLSLLYWKEKFYQHGQFLEYASQFGAPFLLLYALRGGNKALLFLSLKICIALTFICHGLYAIGYYPVPGNFQDMTMTLLGVSNAQALLFLKVAGILDIIVGVGIFLKPLEKISLIYCVIWGFATAFARIAANVTYQNLGPDLLQWVPETLYRLPHGFIPLAMLAYFIQHQRSATQVEDQGLVRTYHTSLGTRDRQPV